MNSKQEQFNHKNKHKRRTVGGVVVPAWYMYLGYTGPANGYIGFYGGEITQARDAADVLAPETSNISGYGSGFGGQ